MSTTPLPLPQQQPTPQAPSVASNVAPIAQAAQQAQQDKPGVTEAQMGKAPQQQGGGEKPTVKRAVLSVLGAAAGMGPMVQKINQQHNQQVQVQNQHVIDSVWGAHKAETEARNKVQQYQQIIQDVDQHWNEANNLPDDDPTKLQKQAYLAGVHQDVVKALKEQAQIVQSSQQNIQGLLADPKNRKIMSKAVGYDEKQANAPERQQMIAAIRKSVPGTSPEEAQLESQFPQGSSEGQKGLTPAVTDQVLKSATAQMETAGRGQVAQTKAVSAEEIAKLKGATHGKTGILFDQGVPYGYASPDGKMYAEGDPEMPPSGQTLLTSAKEAYAKYTKLKASTSDATRLRAEAQYGNYLMHAHGVGMDGKPLPGAMQTDTGETVGSTQAANIRPTSQERGRADLADSAREQIASMKGVLNRRRDLFGPGNGQINNLEQWMGTSDPEARAMLASARITADHLAGVFGGRSKEALEGIFKIIYQNRQDPDATIAALNKMDQAAAKIQKKGTVHAIGSSNDLRQDFPGAPKVGTTEGGYTYRGGDPGNKDNWVKVGK